MFGSYKTGLSLLLSLLMGITFIGCSDSDFGTDGSFSGASKQASKKVVVEDDDDDCIPVKKEDDINSNDIGSDGGGSDGGGSEGAGSEGAGSEGAGSDGATATKSFDLGNPCPNGDDDDDLTEDDDNAGDDDDDDDDDGDGIDWDDEDTAGLREAMKVTQTSGDEDASIKISFVTSSGSGPEQKVNFKEDEKATKEAPQICRKKGITKIKVVLVNDEGDGGPFTPQQGAEDQRWTRQGNNIKVIIDMDGCGFGTCLDPGEDNEYTFECPDSKVEIEGLAI